MIANSWAAWQRKSPKGGGVICPPGELRLRVNDQFLERNAIPNDTITPFDRGQIVGAAVGVYPASAGTALTYRIKKRRSRTSGINSDRRCKRI